MTHKLTTTYDPNNRRALRAFHNDRRIKTKYLRRVRTHARLDQIIHGKYWEDGKGCAVGCTVHSSSHLAYEIELGIPIELAYYEDSIFEGLPNGEAREWPERFLAVIKPGADLTRVNARLAVWEARDPEYGMLQLAKTEEEREIVNLVAALYQREAEGLIPIQSEWDSAYARTGTWAWAGARSLARVWVGERARVWAGAWAGAGAETERWRILSKKLISLLESCD